MVEVRQGAGGEETRRGEEKRGEEEEEDEKREEKEEDEDEEDEEEATDIKSNNPHLAGGELYMKLVQVLSSFRSWPSWCFLSARGFLFSDPLKFQSSPWKTVRANSVGITL